MRRTHWACLLIGVTLGAIFGALLVILQLKYGSGPAVSGDVTAQAETESCLDEPQPLDESATGDAGDIAQPSVSDALPPSAGLLPPVPCGPVQVTVVKRTNSDSDGVAPGAAEVPGLEQVQQRMLNSLIGHAQAGAQNIVVAAGESSDPAQQTLAAVNAPAVEQLPVPPHADEAVTVQPAPAPMPVEPNWPRCVPGVDPRYVPLPPPVPVMVPVPYWPPPVVAQPGRRRTRVPFVGTYASSLGTDGELTLPNDVQESIGKSLNRTLFVELEQDGQFLVLWTAGDLKRCVECEDSGCTGNEEQDRERRLWYSHVRRVKVYGNGCKLTLPAEMIKAAGLKENLVLIGVRDHFEIWDAERWDKYSHAPAASGASLNLRQMLNNNEGLRCIEEDWERIWYPDQPPPCNPQAAPGQGQ